MSIDRFRDNTDEARFELDVDGQVAWADYRRDASHLVIDHVEAPMSLRGTGAAGRLMDLVAAEARDAGLKIIPICGYAAAWLRRHRQYADLIA
jgi:predicted GNAT family acetyltransferase